jgi:hypothetical protein
MAVATPRRPSASLRSQATGRGRPRDQRRRSRPNRVRAKDGSPAGSRRAAARCEARQPGPRAAGTRPAINATATTPSPPVASPHVRQLPPRHRQRPTAPVLRRRATGHRTPTGDVVPAVTLPPSSSVPRTGARDRSRSLRLRPCHHACRRVQHWSPPSRGYVGITHIPKRSGHSLECWATENADGHDGSFATEADYEPIVRNTAALDFRCLNGLE